jgi:hypothetical protein
MRKTRSSGKTVWRTRLSSRADSRSCPNGFSMTTRAPSAAPDLPSCSMTVAKSDGGIAR